MNLSEIVQCPPAVKLTGQDGVGGFLLAWLHVEKTGDWRAIITYFRRVSGAPRRELVDVAGSSILPLEPPVAYRDVPRLQLTRQGRIVPWERPPPHEP